MTKDELEELFNEHCSEMESGLEIMYTETFIDVVSELLKKKDEEIEELKSTIEYHESFRGTGECG